VGIQVGKPIGYKPGQLRVPFCMMGLESFQDIRSPSHRICNVLDAPTAHHTQAGRIGRSLEIALGEGGILLAVLPYGREEVVGAVCQMQSCVGPG